MPRKQVPAESKEVVQWGRGDARWGRQAEGVKEAWVWSSFGVSPLPGGSRSAEGTEGCPGKLSGRWGPSRRGPLLAI